MNTKYLSWAFGIYTFGVFLLGSIVGAIVMLSFLAWRAGW